MNTRHPTRPQMDERIQLALPAEEKRKLFEIAAQRRTTVSELIRSAIARAEGEMRAA